MAIAKIEPSGCGVHKGRVKLRLDFFMSPDDPHYDKHYVYVPVFPEEGYQGKVDESGTPLDQADYDAWIESLPHIWQNNPFHSHFIYPDKDTTDADIKAEIERCLDYFYTFHQYAWDNDKQFIDKWKKVPRIKGTIRDVFIKGNPKDLKKCQLKVDDIKNRIAEFEIGKKIASDADLNIGDKGTITIGAPATDRASDQGYGKTLIGLDNPANADGTIDTFEVWANENIGNFRAGTFYLVSGSDYKCRDSETIGGVTVGSPDPDVFTGLDCDVVTGDYVGCYYAEPGRMEKDAAGFLGIYRVTGEYIDPGDQATYSLYAGDAMSLYGTGEEEAVAFIPTVTII